LWNLVPRVMQPTAFAIDALFASHSPDLAALYYPAAPVIMQREHTSERLQRAMSGFQASFGVPLLEVVGIMAYPKPGTVLVAYPIFDRQVVLSRYERRLLARVAFHLESSYRLRTTPEAIVAEIRDDGRVLEHTRGAPAEEALVAHVATIERARS